MEYEHRQPDGTRLSINLAQVAYVELPDQSGAVNVHFVGGLPLLGLQHESSAHGVRAFEDINERIRSLGK